MRDILQAKVGLAAVGVGIGLLHLPISLAFNVTITAQGSTARTIVLLLYPIAVAVTGLGAVLAMRFPTMAKPSNLRFAGLAILTYLSCTLRYNFATDDTNQLFLSAVINFVAVAIWYLFLGATQTGMIAVVRKQDSSQLGRAWAWHLIGLFLGYLLSETVTETFGANATLFAAGLALILRPKWAIWTVFGLLFAGHSIDLDERLERHRLLDGRLRADVERNIDRTVLPTHLSPEPTTMPFIHLDWSRFGQFRVRQIDEFQVGVLYNFKFQYKVANISNAPTQKRLRFRIALYESVPRTDEVAIIASGGGRSVHLFEKDTWSRITAIERDPSAARYFAETHPEQNQSAYLGANFINADGRAAIETSTKNFDTIILESSLYQPTHTMLPMATPFFYLTKEALNSYLKKLNPGGLIAFEVRTYADRGRDRRDYLPYQILVHLSRKGLHARAVRCGKGEAMYLLASTDPERIQKSVQALEKVGYAEPGLRNKAKKKRKKGITDNRPFANWRTLPKDKRHMYLGISGSLIAVGVFLGLIMTWARRKETGWLATPWFWTLGYFHAALQFHTFHLWRTYFGDSLKTVWWLIIINFALGGLASALAGPLQPRLGSRTVRLLGTSVLFGLHFWACSVLPFNEPSLALRAVYGIVALIPSSILLGIWMPLGLRSASTSGLGNWLAADAIGTLVAASTIFMVLIPYGGRAYGLTVVVTGLLIAALWRPTRP